MEAACDRDEPCAHVARLVSNLPVREPHRGEAGGEVGVGANGVPRLLFGVRVNGTLPQTRLTVLAEQSLPGRTPEGARGTRALPGSL